MYIKTVIFIISSLFINNALSKTTTNLEYMPDSRLNSTIGLGVYSSDNYLNFHKTSDNVISSLFNNEIDKNKDTVSIINFGTVTRLSETIGSYIGFGLIVNEFPSNKVKEKESLAAKSDNAFSGVYSTIGKMLDFLYDDSINVQGNFNLGVLVTVKKATINIGYQSGVSGIYVGLGKTF